MSYGFVRMYECNACGARYPLIPYYKANAGHGKNKDCKAPMGWSLVREEYPPTKPDPEHYPFQQERA